MAVKETRKTREEKLPEVVSGDVSNYEMVVIFKTMPSDQENEKSVEDLKRLIEGLGGTISQLEPWGKKKLAYPISHLNEGYYVLAKFTLVPGNTREMENKIRIDERIIRHMLIVEESQS